MPVYEYNHSNPKKRLAVILMDGKQVELWPGQQATLRFFTDHPDLTLINELPVVEPNKESRDFTFVTAGDTEEVAILPGCRYFVIHSMVGGFKFYPQALTVTPVAIPAGIGWTQLKLNGEYSKIILECDTDGGSCSVQQLVVERLGGQS